MLFLGSTIRTRRLSGLFSRRNEKIKKNLNKKKLIPIYILKMEYFTFLQPDEQSFGMKIWNFIKDFITNLQEWTGIIIF